MFIIKSQLWNEFDEYMTYYSKRKKQRKYDILLSAVFSSSQQNSHINYSLSITPNFLRELLAKQQVNILNRDKLLFYRMVSILYNKGRIHVYMSN